MIETVLVFATAALAWALVPEPTVGISGYPVPVRCLYQITESDWAIIREEVEVTKCHLRDAKYMRISCKNNGDCSIVYRRRHQYSGIFSVFGQDQPITVIHNHYNTGGTGQLSYVAGLRVQPSNVTGRGAALIEVVWTMMGGDRCEGTLEVQALDAGRLTVVKSMSELMVAADILSQDKAFAMSEQFSNGPPACDATKIMILDVNTGHVLTQSYVLGERTFRLHDSGRGVGWKDFRHCLAQVFTEHGRNIDSLATLRRLGKWARAKCSILPR